MEVKLASEAEFYVQQSYDAGQRLLHIINDLIEVTKIDYGKEVLNMNPFYPKKTLSNVLDLLRVAALNKKLELKSDLEGMNLKENEDCLLLGDETKLWQIATNIVCLLC